MLETLAALAEPNRFRIVELLRDGPQSVNAIGATLGLNNPQVSKHLRVLKAAALVEVEPLAQQRLYALRGEPLRELQTWLDGYRELWEERFDQLDNLLTEMSQAPSPTSTSTRKDKRHAKRK